MVSNDLLYCLGDNIHSVVLKARGQQTAAAFCSDTCQALLPHPILARAHCVSPAGVFRSKHLSKTGFSSASFQLSYIAASCRASYFKALMLTRKLAELQAASDHVGIAWHWRGAGHDIPGVVALLSLNQNHCIRSRVARLHHFLSKSSGPPKHKSSLLLLFANCVSPRRYVV